MTEEFTVTQVPTWQRTLVIVLYILISFGVLWGIAHLATSASCYANSGCDKIDQVIYAVASVFVFIFSFIWVVLGIKGLLPGAKRSLHPVNKS